MAAVTDHLRAQSVSEPTTRGRRWPLWGLAAGVFGAVATIFTNVTDHHPGVGPSAVEGLSGATYHLGGAVGYLAVACLMVLAGCWRTATARSLPGSAAARVAADGFVASAAALTLGYGWKLAMALYLPGGLDHDSFGQEGRFVYFMLNDFGAFIGWLGVVVAAGAVAWLGLRERAVATWLAVVSLLPVIAVVFMGCGMAIAGYQGIVGPIWLVLGGAGLAFGRHRI